MLPGRGKRSVVPKRCAVEPLCGSRVALEAPGWRVRLRIAACALYLLARVAIVAPAVAAVEDDPFVVTVGQRQLFLDDHDIEHRAGFQRRLHQPQKKGAVIRPDAAMGEDFIQSRTAPIWNPQRRVFQFWNLYGPEDLPGATGYYESADGLHWTKPVVGQVEYRGSTENNYITCEGHRITMVVYDADEPDPSARYKSFLPNVGFAVSPDGIAWRLLDVPAVRSADNFSFSLDAQSHLFISAVKTGGPFGRCFALSTSGDFRSWTKPQLAFHADERDQQIGRHRIAARFANPSLHHPCYNIPETYHVDVYMASVFRYESRYIGMPTMYYQTGKVPPRWSGFDRLPLTPQMRQIYKRDGDWAGFHEVQLAVSRDLSSWHRLGNRAAFIDSSPIGAGAYDTANIKPPAAPVVRGDELWLYYTGGRYYGIVLDRPQHRQAGAICLAVLRRDGFVSLEAGATPGVVVTRAFAVPGSGLWVNVDAGRGHVAIEVIGPTGELVARSQPLTGDVRGGRVSWTEGSLRGMGGQTCRLRFTARRASLYSYWFSEH